ncbi:MAG TPA: AAA family ATPase [Thermoleophilia bacterium]|nr:AAA family ATPase [Thermoleophilia bacterium]
MSKPNGTVDVREAFGLRSIPFTREIVTRWGAAIFDEVLSDLRTVVDNRMSAALIAPAGTGKTALLRALASDLPEARYRVHYVKVTSLSKRDFCREVAATMGLEPVGTYPNLVRKLQDKVEDTAFHEGVRPVLLVDEAHDMRPDVLAILRILTNFQMDSKLVLSVVLSGQPPLAQMLAGDELVAVRQRIAHCATLRCLSREESRSYVEHRMTEAGARSLPFDDLALDAIYEISRGNLRAVDHLARKALEIAAKKGISTVDAALITAARAQLPS